MTQIDFYVLDTDDTAIWLMLIEQLAMRSIGGGKKVHIHTTNAARTDVLADMFGDLVGANDSGLSIDHAGDPDGQQEELINLAPEVPHFFSRFERTLEVIYQQEPTRAIGRERYKYYQCRGYPLRHIKIQHQSIIRSAHADCDRQAKLALTPA